MPDFPKIDLSTTVCAIATPIGRGGLGIVRLSGPRAIKIADSVFKGSDNKALKDHPGFTVHHGHFHEPESGVIIDEVLATVFRKPKSFTGEDIVEFSAHGGPTVLRRIDEILAEQGANPAAPGEFTLRAFLNGRIDLTEAEAVADIINAKTNEAAEAAAKQIQGVLYQEVKVLRNELITALSRLEMGIDFTEEDLDPKEVESVGARLVTVKERLISLAEGYTRGRILRDGFTIVLAGPPNAGKSTLFNRLAQDERAIVTDIPGTTRDVLREYINIDGWPVCIVDTAGIRQATDLIEQIGVSRSNQAIGSADGALWLIDQRGDWSEQTPPKQFQDLSSPWSIVVNKLDLVDDSRVRVSKIISELTKSVDPIPTVIGLSAKTGDGVDTLLGTIKSWINQLGMPDQSASITINDRHRLVLERATQSIDKALAALNEQGQLDLVAFDAKAAADTLGEIIGTTTTDDILAEIFSNFCIGK